MAKLDDIVSNKTLYPDDQVITLADGTTATLGSVRGGYLRTADYTRKTQDLSAAQRRLEEDKAANDAAIAQAREDLVKLAEKAQAQPNPQNLTSDQQIDKLLQEDPAARRLWDKAERAEKRAEAIETQMRQAQEHWQRQQQDNVRQYHERTIAQLQQKDPSLDRDALTRYALDNGIARLDKAYELMTEETRWSEREKTVRDEERRKAEHEIRQQQAVLPVRRSFVPPPADNADIGEFNSVQEGFEKAARAAENDPEIQALMWGQTGA